ncbi:acetate--CoA ligase family protein [Pseudooceanicola sp.]|uniref:acetate--CoA ligase family protein n=1 Tax=Pseudooceanicola sp. TaxID=1914328 RepID=UPI00260C0D16|nr:acetate--CoA ligase family protein [Pseudooceanicola sp.]MDF1856438.1 acetate--CoA ligase family protein [Pseudooceanicola sp.]
MTGTTAHKPPLPDDFFRPSSMAFVGATPDLDTIRGRLFHFTIKNGYTGALYPIHPTHKEIHGAKCYASILDVKAPVDLAVIAIPAKLVPDVVDQCAEAEVKNVMIISSGFAEEGGAATALQDRILATAEKAGMRIVGPNSEGFFNAVTPVSATFSPVVESLDKDEMAHARPDRRVGVVSQSGGMGFAIFTRGRNLGISFSHVISTGNEADLTAADYMDVMVRDPDTDVIVVLCESIRDGDGFCRAAAAARAAGKPVIVCKLGRSAAGARAAASHTASLTGEHSAYRAVFRKYGLIEAAEMDEAVALAAVFATCAPPRGRRVGIVTASGGGGTTTADIFADFDLTVPELSAPLQAEIEKLIPPHASALNPVDTTAQGASTGPVSMQIAEMLEQSDEVDLILGIVSAARETSVSLLPDKLRGIQDRGKVPILVWTYTLASKLAKVTAAEGGTVLMTDLRQCGLALAKLAEYGAFLASPTDDDATSGPALTRPDTTAGALTEMQSKAWLAGYDIGGEGDVLAGSGDAAAAAADAIGYPVVLKIQSPDILHKTEVGGVRVGLKDAETVRAAYGEIVSNAAQKAPKAKVDGVLVQKMAPKGVELVIGMVNDATFGPIMMIGAGGVAVELYGDVLHYPAPFGPAKAEELLRSLKSAPLFDGFRGAAPIDLKPAAALISRISQAAMAGRDYVAEMEFNPVILHADGSGISVADAVVILK